MLLLIFAHRHDLVRLSREATLIIDGRIADLCCTGLLSRSLIAPRFVLAE